MEHTHIFTRTSHIHTHTNKTRLLHTHFGCTLCVADQLTMCSPDTATWRGEVAEKMGWSSGYRKPQAKTPAMLAGSSRARALPKARRAGGSGAYMSRPVVCGVCVCVRGGGVMGVDWKAEWR